MVAPSGSLLSGLRRARSVRPPLSPFLKNQRLASKKYVVGEGHVDYRGPRIMHYLRAQLRVAMNSTILVSPFLNPALAFDDGDLSPTTWIVNLPSRPPRISIARTHCRGRRWRRSSPMRAASTPRISSRDDSAS